MSAAAQPDEASLRAEHDALAASLAARASIDHARRGAYLGFATFVVSGLAVKLAFDRWFSTRVTRFRGPPIFFYLALAAAVLLLACTLVEAVRSRRLMRGEDARFARLSELRRRLELDP
ncbi:hypothetical protein [Anaeromyxobacter diazotrophicus]|uniref:Uncharacterized protein n=1 Tax=Anaeromyxobacter diazotrophicus TaxID=2590199 RepID=A0A7I9VQQ0_9BACT|nr:hypothetical protein [Anaeromyxobacter diazotrophicus]GEJ58450.1 hypothetical protein AMYX_31910 [Anaeromyxobacter diazotrophicus]